MKNCKSCNSEISKKAKTCPNCGLDQRNFFKKHKFITFLLVIIVFSVISGTSNTETVNTNTPKSEESTKSDETKEIGLKVNSVSDWNDPDGFQTPKEGNKFVEVDFDITNNSVEDGLNMNPLYFGVETETTTVDTSMIVSENNPDSGLDMKTGTTKNYSMVFEIPNDDTVIGFTYDNMFKEETIEVTE